MKAGFKQQIPSFTDSFIKLHKMFLEYKRQ